MDRRVSGRRPVGGGRPVEKWRVMDRFPAAFNSFFNKARVRRGLLKTGWRKSPGLWSKGVEKWIMFAHNPFLDLVLFSFT